MPSNPLAQIVASLRVVAAPVDPPADTATSPVEASTGAAVGSGPDGGRHVVAREIDDAPDELARLLHATIDETAKEAAEGASLAELERSFAAREVTLAQRGLALVFATACRTVMLADLRARGLKREDVRLRTDEAGYVTVHTTYGPITFPTFAYRDLTTPLGSVTRTPARALLEYHRSCRSSPLCLEWEARLGAQHPFRKAEEMLHFFTRGASTVEDTTIARHMLALSEMIEPEWLYKTPEDVRRTLRQKATRDKTTGRPVIYVSSDAHALRRYVGDTWALHWKMVNGIRVWCEDAATGEIVHLGGEFTWGDCREVGKRIKALVAAGILPNDDAAWQELNAKIVFVSDGSDWLLEHIVPLLVGATVILDPYHLIDWFAQFTKLAFGAGSPVSRKLHAKLRRILFNKRSKGSKAASQKSAPRRGHTKTRRRRNPHAYDRPWDRRGRPRTVSTDFTARALLDLLADVTVTEPEHQEALDALVERIAKNTTRIDYPAYLARGLQVGSGAMESLHRTGSQLRLKLPGSHWLEETSQAMLQFRMLELSGRWREFWDQADVVSRIAQAFEARRTALRSKGPTSAAA